MKKTGILFPISALPSAYGVGDFGQNAYQFIDKIAAAHLEIWQILPGLTLSGLEFVSILDLL